MVDKTTDATFDQDVLKASGPVVVDFWAEWCGPCRMIAPALEEISKSLNGKVKIVKLNVDENPNTAAKFGIMSIPTLMLFKDGQLALYRAILGRVYPGKTIRAALIFTEGPTVIEVPGAARDAALGEALAR